MKQSDIGVIGLGVMGENLARNFINNGYAVAVFDRDAVRVRKFSETYGNASVGAYSISDFCASLSRPRKILVMIPAGAPVDNVIEGILPYLETGDVFIDGGNSFFEDTNRRYKDFERKGFLYVGAGVSGGEEGALNGPSIMPGGAKAAWPIIKEPLQAISAKVSDGVPCCDWVGSGGSGHLVKMVHNGIEYGDMQVICEAYHLLKQVYGFTNDELSKVFSTWNQGPLNSFLIEITSEILKKKDENGNAVLDLILDVAGQKGTGKWTGILALQQGIPVTLIAEAVFARFLSSQKSERIKASKVFSVSPDRAAVSPQEKVGIVKQLEHAVYASKIISYAQGFSLLRASSESFTWDIDYAAIAKLWRGGCIIRSSFLDNIVEAYTKNPQLENLLLDSFFSEKVTEAESGWREVVMCGVKNRLPLPSMSSALTYFDGYTSEHLPANMIQAQRDFFGSHTYERIDRSRGEFFHTVWNDS